MREKGQDKIQEAARSGGEVRRAFGACRVAAGLGSGREVMLGSPESAGWELGAKKEAELRILHAGPTRCRRWEQAGGEGQGHSFWNLALLLGPQCRVGSGGVCFHHPSPEAVQAGSSQTCAAASSLSGRPCQETALEEEALLGRKGREWRERLHVLAWEAAAWSPETPPWGPARTLVTSAPGPVGRGGVRPRRHCPVLPEARPLQRPVSEDAREGPASGRRGS